MRVGAIQSGFHGNYDGHVTENHRIVSRIGKTVMILVAVVAVFVLSGCSLIGLDDVGDNGEIFFYDMVEGEGSDTTDDYTLTYTNNGEYTVIMSRSVGWKRLTKEEAETYRDNYTEFHFSADGETVEPDDDMDVANLGWLLPDWHVVQKFSIGPFEQRDEITLIGETVLNTERENFDTRTSTVNVTIK